jgi:hypothetical protein
VSKIFASIGLAVYSCPLEIWGELDVFGPSDANIEIIGGRAELTESKLLTFRPAGMDTILRHVDKVVSDVKAYHGVIHAIVGADSRHNDVVSARAEIQLLQLFFHGSFIEAVVGVLLYDYLVRRGLKLLNKLHRRAVLGEGVLLTKEREFGMIFRSH